MSPFYNRPKVKQIIVATHTFLIVLFLLSIPIAIHLPPQKAHAASFTLYGRFNTPTGWGTSPTTVSQPGPDLVVTAGETVTLSLFSGDSLPHQFCVDYESTPDFICQGSEIPTESPTFSSPTRATPWSFTATTVPGNYT